MSYSAVCKICGKPLSDPVSMELGIGPVCAISRKRKEKESKDSNLFGNRASYCWGIDGQLIWLKDNGGPGRSLTNDLENCLLEIIPELPSGILNYVIIYRDSECVWDAVKIKNVEIHEGRLANAIDWIKYETERNRPHYTNAIDIDFLSLGNEKDFVSAKVKALNLKGTLL